MTSYFYQGPTPKEEGIFTNLLLIYAKRYRASIAGQEPLPHPKSST